MTRSRSDLANGLEEVLGSTQASISEARDGVVISELDGAAAKRLIRLFQDDNWVDLEIFDLGGSLPPALIDDEDHHVTLRARNASVPADVQPFLTSRGLTQALEREQASGRVWVHGLLAAFETLSVRFAPWGDLVHFLPGESVGSARRVVRVLDDGMGFPRDLGAWLLKDARSAVEGSASQVWRRLAMERLVQALADEIEPSGSLLFRGPPAVRFAPKTNVMVEAKSLTALQEAVAWTFGNPRETENRHTLFAAEIARAAVRMGDAADLAGLCSSALDSAKIAYSFGVSQQSRDTLKALSELRKAVGDETAKVGETTRALATAISGSAVANLSIIIARLVLPTGSQWVPSAAVMLGVVSLAYVGLVTLSGFQFLGLQSDLRAGWRERLYSFLSEDEYVRMVSDPVAKAERAFGAVALGSGIIALLLFISVLIVVNT